MTRAQDCPGESWLHSRLRAGRSREEIAEECGVDGDTVEAWIDRFDVRPYRDEEWLRARVEDYRTPGQIAATCAVTRRTVERWMERFDVERPDPPTVPEMEAHLDERFDDPDAATKKERIVALLAKFGDLAPKGRVVEVVGCSADYASRFHWSEEDLRVVQRHRRGRESQSIHDRLRRSVLERDEHRCVRCGAGDGGDGPGGGGDVAEGEVEGADEEDEEVEGDDAEDEEVEDADVADGDGSDVDAGDLEIHHVIPGESEERNLATLCRACHLDAHGGAFGEGVVYGSREEFWEEWVTGEPSE